MKLIQYSAIFYLCLLSDKHKQNTKRFYIFQMKIYKNFKKYNSYIKQYKEKKCFIWMADFRTFESLYCINCMTSV